MTDAPVSRAMICDAQAKRGVWDQVQTQPVAFPSGENRVFVVIFLALVAMTATLRGHVARSLSGLGRICPSPASIIALLAAVLVVAAGAGKATAGSLLDEVPAVSQSWTVPAGVTEVRLTAEGASGGLRAGGGNGGSGATVSGVFSVAPGDIIRYVVGQQPPATNEFEGGGGGSTGIFINGTLAVVAGGGGGYDNTQTGGAQNFGQVGTSGANSIPQSTNCTNGGTFGTAFGGVGGNGGEGGDTNNGPLCTSITGGGGGGGINSAGEQGFNQAGGGGGAADLNPLDGLIVAAGGLPATGAGGDPFYASNARGGAGFTGGGGGVLRAGGGGGGYSGGSGANSGVWPGGGGSFVAPSSQLTTLTAGSVNSNAGNGSVRIQWSTLTLNKLVVNDSGRTAVPGDFMLRLTSTGGEYDGTEAFSTGDITGIDSNGTSNSVTLGEDAIYGYEVSANTCAPLTHTLAAIGTDYTCTITNDDLALIEAVVDDYSTTPFDSLAGGATGSVLDNDLLFGEPFDPADIILTPGALDVTPTAGSITMGPDGIITVAPGTTAGTYEYTYTICEAAAPTICSTTTATVVVAEPVIEAIVDDFTATPINGFAGGATGSVLDNDLLNGVAFDPADIILTPGTLDATPTAGSITMGADGIITVGPGTTAGTYVYEYTICDRVNLTNCSTTTATIVVAEPVIEAIVDDFTATPINGFAGGATGSVLDNDLLNGVAVDLADIILTPGTLDATPTAGSITMGPDGIITVGPGTTAGTYVYEYTICDRVNLTNCSTTTATIVVAEPVIEAVDDAPTAVSGLNGATLPTVLANDTLNGDPVDPADITLTPGALDVTPAFGSITMDADGIITVAAGTTAGTYVYEYTICDRVNPANCSTAIATIIVDEAAIDAVDDAPVPVNGLLGGITGSVLDNDSLNGEAVDPADIDLTPGALDVTPAEGSITMNPDGTITIAPGTTAGTYAYTYTICEATTPENCDTAIATIIVTAPEIDAVDDDYTATPINGFDGGALPTVLGNDTLNGVAVDPAEITLTPGALDVTPAAGSITMNTDGTISIAPGTTAGTYQYSYEICEILNPENCDTAVATIVVNAGSIDALDDDHTDAPIDGATGGNLPSVLENDTLNGAPVDPADVILTPGTAPTPAAGSITMNPDGTITIAPGTTAGTYTYPYTICEILNPTNCATATATIVVTSSSISIEKTAALDDGGDGVADAGDTVTYSYVVTNTGTANVLDVTVTETAFSGTGAMPVPVYSTGGSDEDGEGDAIDLVEGASASFTAIYQLTQADVDAGQIENQALAAGTNPYGQPVTDTSDDPTNSTNTDPDGDGNPDDPTVLPLPASNALRVTKVDTLDLGSNGIADVGDTVTYNFVVTNEGNRTLTNVTVTDPMVAVTGGPIPSLAPGESDSTTFVAVYALTQADLDAGEVVNVATATGNDPLLGQVVAQSDDPTDGSNEDSDGDGNPDDPTVTPLPVLRPSLDASKSVSNRNPQMGEIVTYTLTFENSGAAVAANISLVDQLPTAIQYVEGSATLDGAPREPVIAGRELTWAPVTIPVGGKSSVTFEARVLSLDNGETAINQTWAEDEDGDPISDVAEAEIERRPEHVFDCTDVIGKVFDDTDMDGYQDDGETGIAGARVVTLNGELITTDEHGRFSLPCAAMPPSIGDNISLKLDTRSLPTGYRVTSENPRVVRATAGKMVRVNFGVSIGKITDIDLMDAAFAPGSAQMSQALVNGIGQLVEQIRNTPGMVRLSYYANGEDRRLIDARLDAVEGQMRALWRDRGRYKLIIERTSKQIQ